MRELFPSFLPYHPSIIVYNVILMSQTIILETRKEIVNATAIHILLVRNCCCVPIERGNICHQIIIIYSNSWHSINTPTGLLRNVLLDSILLRTAAILNDVSDLLKL